VRAAEAPEWSPIAAALADAFWDDPVQQYLLPTEPDRARRLTGLFGMLLRGHYIPLGSTFTTPDHTGGALWAPPGKAVLPPLTIARYGPAMLKALGRYTVRSLRVLSIIEKHHPKEPHWYLGVLGTRTTNQGKGIGSALMKPVLDRCDADGIPAYLESSKHSNLAFYRRYGFEVTGEIALPDDGPPVWPMWREPRPVAL
jgi:ribosomal protein S18 acetylase RimI-like enzyme